MKWIVVALGAALVLLFGIDQCAGREPTPKIAPKNQRTLDSLAATRETFNDRRDTVLLRARVETVTAVHYVAASAETERRARSAARRADSLADVGTAWREAYDARTAEAVELDSALTQKDSAWRSERASRISFQTLYADDTLRRRAIEKVNAGLRDDISKLDRPCHFGPVRCPSRTASAFAGALLAVAVRSTLPR